MSLLFTGLLFAASMTVRVDQAAVRSGCESGDVVVAKVPAASPVEIRFAMSGSSGTCYKVNVTVGDKVVSGYLPATALAGLDSFEKGLQEAPAMEVSHQMERQVASLEASAVQGPADHPLMKASELMKSKQPRQALDVIEAAMKVTGRDYRYLVLGGIAAYESDDAKKALDYLQEAEQFKQDPQVESWIAKLKREVGNDKSGERLYGNRFLLRYEGGVLDPDAARTMVSVLESEFSRISLQLGCRTDDRIVTIVQSPQAFRSSTELPAWSGGVYDGKIRVPVPETKNVSDRTRTTFAHELVHACLANMGNFPAWLHEGLAQRFSGEALHPELVSAVKIALKNKTLPTLSQMSRGFTNLKAQDAALAYGYSRIAVDTMMDRYRAYGIQNVLRSPERLHEVETEIDKMLAQ